MGKYVKDKTLDAILKDKVKLGWELKRGKHLKLYHPLGGMVTISASPSCYRGYTNAIKDIEKLTKQKG